MLLFASAFALASQQPGVERKSQRPVKMPAYSAGSGWTGDSSLVYTGDRIQTPASSVNVELSGIGGGGGGEIDLAGKTATWQSGVSRQYCWGNPGNDHSGCRTCSGIVKTEFSFVDQTSANVRFTTLRCTKYSNISEVGNWITFKKSNNTFVSGSGMFAVNGMTATAVQNMGAMTNGAVAAIK